MTAYYVKGDTGNDTTGVGTEASPWATLTKALPLLQDNDTLYLMGDSSVVYLNQWPATTNFNSGLPGRPITVKQYAGAACSIKQTAGNISFTQKNYWTFDGLIYEKSGTTALNSGKIQIGTNGVASSTCKNFRFINCKFQHITASPFMNIGYANNLEIDNCLFWNIRSRTLGTDCHAILLNGGDLTNGGYRITNNIFRDIGSDGVQRGNTQPDVEILFEGNLFEVELPYNCRDGQGNIITSGTGYFSYVGENGIDLKSPGGATGLVTIRKNTIRNFRPNPVNTRDGSGARGESIIIQNGAFNVLIEKNWFENNTHHINFESAANSSATIRNNIFKYMSYSGFGAPGVYGHITSNNTGFPLTIEHNTFHQPTDVNTTYVLNLSGTFGGTLNMRNNAFLGGRFLITNTPTGDQSYNGYQDITGDKAKVAGTGDITATTPTTLGIGTTDYRPSANTASVYNAGVNVGIGDDYYSYARTTPDIGAAEFVDVIPLTYVHVSPDLTGTGVTHEDGRYYVSASAPAGVITIQNLARNIDGDSATDEWDLTIGAATTRTYRYVMDEASGTTFSDTGDTAGNHGTWGANATRVVTSSTPSRLYPMTEGEGNTLYDTGTSGSHATIPVAVFDEAGWSTASAWETAAELVPVSDIGVTVQAHSTVLDNTTAAYTTATETLIATTNTRTLAAGEPTGIDPATPTTMSFVYGAGATATFTLTPSGATVDIWIGGTKYALSGAQVVNVTKTTGLWFIYYTAGGWVSSQTPWTIGSTQAPVAAVYINTTLGAGLLADERHGISMDWATHARLHAVDGSQISSGGTLAGYTVSGTAANSNPAADHVQMTVEQTTLRDEDIVLSLGALSAGSYFVPRRDGAGSTWTWTTETVPYLANNQTVNPSTGFIQYNQLIGGTTWQMTNLASGQFVNYYIFATDFVDPVLARFIFVPGQAVHADLTSAQAESVLSLNLAGFPTGEFAPLYQVTYRCSTNANYEDMIGRAAIAANPVRLVGFNAAVQSTVSPSSHSALSNRADTDSHPASAVSIIDSSALLTATNVETALTEIATTRPITFATVDDMISSPLAIVGSRATVDNYSATALSGPLNFIAVAAGTGTATYGNFIDSIGNPAIEWQQLFGATISVESFGAPAGDLTDHGRIQQAIDNVAVQGGGVVTVSSNTIVLFSAITVKSGVTLLGDIEHTGGWKADTTYQGSMIQSFGDVNPFILQSNSGIVGIRIQKVGTEYPQTRANSSAWTNTAITATSGSGLLVKNCFILGYLRACDFGSTSCARINLESLEIDCLNGVRISNSVDVDRLIGVHVWPFLSNATEVNTHRDGVGIEIKGGGSWSRLEHCFVFGHDIGYLIDDSEYVSLDNCAVDGQNVVDTWVGVSVTGDSRGTKIDNMNFGGAYTKGIVINIDPSPDALSYGSVQINGCKAGGASSTEHVEIVSAGRVTLTGNNFTDGDVAVKMSANVACRISMSGNQFVNQTTAPFSNATASWTSPIWMIDGSNSISRTSTSTSTWENAIEKQTTQASAANTYLPSDYDVFNLTGTDAINAFYGSWPGRVVVIKATSGFTINSGVSIKLQSGTSRILSAGESVSFLCAGVSWWEISGSVSDVAFLEKYGKPKGEPWYVVSYGDSNAATLSTGTVTQNDNVYEWYGTYADRNTPANYDWVVCNPAKTVTHASNPFIGIMGGNRIPAAWKFCDELQKETGDPVYWLNVSQGSTDIVDMAPSTGTLNTYLTNHAAVAVGQIPNGPTKAHVIFNQMGTNNVPISSNQKSPEQYRDAFWAIKTDFEGKDGLADADTTTWLMIGFPRATATDAALTYYQHYRSDKSSLQRYAANQSNQNVLYVPSDEDSATSDGIHLVHASHLALGATAKKVFVDKLKTNDGVMDASLLSHRWPMKSEVADSATAVAFQRDTEVSLTTAGAMLEKVSNAGVLKYSLSKDGDITANSIALTSIVNAVGYKGGVRLTDITSATTSLTTSDYFLNTSGTPTADRTIALPAVSTCVGQIFYFYNSAGGTYKVILDPDGSETFPQYTFQSGVSSQVVAQGELIQMVALSAGWYILSRQQFPYGIWTGKTGTSTLYHHMRNVVVTAAGATTQTLPLVAECYGMGNFVIKNYGAGTVTVARSGSDLFYGQTATATSDELLTGQIGIYSPSSAILGSGYSGWLILSTSVA